MRLRTIRQVFQDAKARGYLAIETMKNKDNHAWTMPKDPLHLKIELLDEMPNIYAEDLFTQEYDDSSAFISENDRNYLFSYHQESFQDMVSRELKQGQERSYLSNQPLITRQIRMSVIDWLYEVMLKKRINDRSVMFQAIELMDAYYQHCGKELPITDL